METTVYVDLFFMINFSMDFLCLYLVSKLLSRRLLLWRGLLAAVFGGIYADVALFFTFGRGISFIIDMLACAVICFIAFFTAREWRRLPIYILVYTAVSMALGGAMTALFNLFNRSGIFEGIKKTDGDGISVWLFALLALISAAITLLGGKAFTGRMSRKEAEIEIVYGQRSVRLRGMTDSGNLLREPISGRPCIVADVDRVAGILPAEIVRISREKRFSELDGIDTDIKRRLTLIPTATATGGGMLLGFRADEVRLIINGKTRDAEAVVALTELDRGADGYGALIPSCLLI